MEKEKTIFDYISQVFVIFGATVLILNMFCLLFGKDAKEVSALFSLGNQGLSVATMLQFLAMSVFITVWRFLFFTDKVIKNLSLSLRTAGMFTAVVLTIIVFVLLFSWFPLDDWKAWLGFGVSFVISVGISLGLSTLKEKTEEEKMARALERLKEDI